MEVGLTEGVDALCGMRWAAGGGLVEAAKKGVEEGEIRPELCYDLLLAKHDNVSASPGFEALGLRIT